MWDRVWNRVAYFISGAGAVTLAVGISRGRADWLDVLSLSVILVAMIWFCLRDESKWVDAPKRKGEGE